MPKNLILPDSLDKAMNNLSDQPTKAMGQTLADLWGLVLGSRVAFAAEKKKIKYAHDLEEFRKSIDRNVDEIPEDKYIEPSMQIAAQSLVDSQYCIESEELREMFANLIARSMHADYATLIHPSFSKIAQQLSPTDAHMLRILHMHHETGIAVVNYIAQSKKAEEGYFLLINNVPAIMPAGCTPEDASYSIASLIHLGLIEVPSDVYFVNDAHYSDFSKTALYQNLQDEARSAGRTLDTQKRVARLTAIGKAFVKICLD